MDLFCEVEEQLMLREFLFFEEFCLGVLFWPLKMLL
jgi:hypothetical protein